MYFFNPVPLEEALDSGNMLHPCLHSRVLFGFFSLSGAHIVIVGLGSSATALVSLVGSGSFIARHLSDQALEFNTVAPTTPWRVTFVFGIYWPPLLSRGCGEKKVICLGGLCASSQGVADLSLSSISTCLGVAILICETGRFFSRHLHITPMLF